MRRKLVKRNRSIAGVGPFGASIYDFGGKQSIVSGSGGIGYLWRVQPTLTESSRSAQVRAWLMLGFLSLIWGTSYILIKKSLVVYSPVEVACLRLSISTLAFLPFAWRRRHRVRRNQLGLLLAIGLTGTALPAFLFSIAQTRVSSAMAGTLNSLTPLFTLLIGMAFFSARPGPARIIGVIIGLAGALCLILFGTQLRVDDNLWYGLLIVAATLCYATSTNLVGYFVRELSSLTISAVSFSLVGLPALVWLLAGSDFTTVLATDPGAWKALGYVAFLALFSTVLASVIFFRLIQETNPVFGSTVSYFVPAVALGWGIADGELISLVHLLGLGLILGGVYLSRHER